VAAQVDNPQQRYLKTQIETASQPQLLVMIFDAAVKKLHISKKAIQEKNIEKAHTELTKVQKIFTELMIALDLEKGGELGTNLLRIYDFLYHHLVKANIKQDIAMIDEAMPIVENLRSAWTEAVEKYTQEQQGDAPMVPNEKTAAKFDSMAAKLTKPKAPAATAPSAMKPKPPAYQPAAFSSPTPTSSEEERPRLNIQG